ncbi:hypothetical protein E6C76_10990 [Pseudothauera nasutitermitis]|uniref:Uncharacterized protein n=1 Tax=Pseudothauera nasutitermitis TaxID=2565930 RepID=A0A4S4AWZ0_9RHOO|nr:hypothetical protein [Pseudothauera nasutitermitis]THF64582.1 hypothetical protein E6C76_10990 [Pseudothauera nasutitermitis]
MDIYVEALRLFGSIFVFQPWRCALVAGIFSIFIASPFHRAYARISALFAALAWWLVTYTEATTPISANIRIDLVMTLPVLLVSGVVAIFALIVGRKARLGSGDPLGDRLHQ